MAAPRLHAPPPPFPLHLPYIPAHTTSAVLQALRDHSSTPHHGSPSRRIAHVRRIARLLAPFLTTLIVDEEHRRLDAWLTEEINSPYNSPTKQARARTHRRLLRQLHRHAPHRSAHFDLNPLDRALPTPAHPPDAPGHSSG